MYLIFKMVIHMKKTDYLNMINEFEKHYHYDCTYMRELLDSSLAGFIRFSNFLPLNNYREKLSLNDYWIAKLSSIQSEDCGECLQLNIRMALEAGVDRGLVETAITDYRKLPAELRDIYQYARYVASNEVIEPELINHIMRRYGKNCLLELGLCVAAARVFPTIKRAAGYAKSCNMIEYEI